MSSNPAMCDTHHFCRQYLDGNVEAIVGSDKLQTLIADFIGNNRFVLLSDDGRMVIINRDQGYSVGDVWVANTYASSRHLIDPTYKAPATRYGHGSYTGYAMYPTRSSPWNVKATDPIEWDDEGIDSMFDDVPLEELGGAVYEAIMQYDDEALTELMRDHFTKVVDIVFDEFVIEEYTRYKSADNTAGVNAAVKAWLDYDWTALRPLPVSDVVTALLFCCDVTHMADLDEKQDETMARVKEMV
jgi:hypothetical protein